MFNSRQAKLYYYYCYYVCRASWTTLHWNYKFQSLFFGFVVSTSLRSLGAQSSLFYYFFENISLYINAILLLLLLKWIGYFVHTVNVCNTTNTANKRTTSQRVSERTNEQMLKIIKKKEVEIHLKEIWEQGSFYRKPTSQL
jgi:hypothetical protein